MNILIFVKMSKLKKSCINALMSFQMNYGKLLKNEKNKTLKSVVRLWRLVKLNLD